MLSKEEKRIIEETQKDYEISKFKRTVSSNIDTIGIIILFLGVILWILVDKFLL